MKRLIKILLLINITPITFVLIGLIKSNLNSNTSIDIIKIIGGSYLIGLPVPIVIYLIFKVCKII